MFNFDQKRTPNAFAIQNEVFQMQTRAQKTHTPPLFSHARFCPAPHNKNMKALKRQSLRFLFPKQRREDEGAEETGPPPPPSSSRTSVHYSRQSRSSFSSILFSSNESVTAEPRNPRPVGRNSSLIPTPFRKMSAKSAALWFLDENVENEQHSASTMEAMDKVKQIVANRTTRQDLINRLIAIDSDYIEKVRFLSCVGEIETTICLLQREKKSRSMVDLFVGDGARFQCRGIPPAVVQKLKAGAHDELKTVRAAFLVELVSKEDFMRALHEVVASV